MKRNWSRRCRCCRAAGLTLIEVSAGLAILGTLLVAILMTEARCRRQAAVARWRIRAARSAELLLAKWWAKPTEFPRRGTGTISGQPGFTWRTRVCENEQLKELGQEVVRLELFAGRASAGPVAVVDVVLPAQAEEQAPEGVHAD